VAEFFTYVWPFDSHGELIMEEQWVLVESGNVSGPYKHIKVGGPFGSVEEAEHFARRANRFLKGGLQRRMSAYRILNPKDFELNLTLETEE